MDNKITQIGDYTNDAMMVSPEGCLRNCLDNEIGKNGAFKDGKKLLILCLDDTKKGYDLSFMQAGMKVSEIVALLEIAKSNFIESMDL